MTLVVVPSGRHDPVDQKRLGERDPANGGDFRWRQTGGLRHQIPNRQVIALGEAVLKIGQAVDPGGVGDLPGGLGQVANRRQPLRREYRAGGWFDDKADVVVLGIDFLERLEGLQLRVFRAEKHPVVAGETEKPGAARGPERGDHGDYDHRPAPANHPVCEGDRGLVAEQTTRARSGPLVRNSGVSPRTGLAGGIVDFR